MIREQVLRRVVAGALKQLQEDVGIHDRDVFPVPPEILFTNRDRIDLAAQAGDPVRERGRDPTPDRAGDAAVFAGGAANAGKYLAQHVAPVEGVGDASETPTHQRESCDPVGGAAVQLEADLSAHRVSDEHRFLHVVRIEHADEIVGEVGNVQSTAVDGEPTAAVASVVPVHHLAVFGQVRREVAPDEAVAADPIVEHHRRLIDTAQHTREEGCSVGGFHKPFDIVLHG